MDFFVSNGVASPESVRMTIRTEAIVTQVAGPYAASARTLPNYATPERLSDNSYQVRISDPAIWSPIHPVYYRLQHGGGSRKIGVRKIEACNQSVFLNGRRTVLRASCGAVPNPETAQQWVDERLSLVISQASVSERILTLATDFGIPVIVEADQANANELADISSWPCVTAIVFSDSLEQTENISKNPLRLWRCSEPELNVPSWAHGIVVSSELLLTLSQPSGGWPLMFVESTADLDQLSVSEQRRMCERLQSTHAPQVDLAGYIIRSS
ncbi:MAG: hypothetical protein KDB27_01245 [Planctomycetales bacterium]|nr:hypothetical protein [Planctomycetales bacterium]